MNVKVRRHLWRLAISSRSSIVLRFITKQAGFLKVQTHCRERRGLLLARSATVTDPR